MEVCKSAACGPPGESAEETGALPTVEYSTNATDCCSVCGESDVTKVAPEDKQ